jgi:uncharacterized RDD family membrane protein YckC
VERLDTVVAIDTPERVRFRYRLAGPGMRAAAWFVDVVIQMGLVMAVAVASAATASVIGGLSIGALLLAAFLVSWFYGAVFEGGLGGRTPGKMVLRIRVVRHDGSPCRWQDAVLRNLLRGVDQLPWLYAVGGVVAMLDARHRRLGDLVAGTMVIAELRSELQAPMDVPAPTEAERADLPPRVVLLRDERRAVEALLRRLPVLNPERAEELATHLAPVVGARNGMESSSALRLLQLAWLRESGRDR